MAAPFDAATVAAAVALASHILSAPGSLQASGAARSNAAVAPVPHTWLASWRYLAHTAMAAPADRVHNDIRLRACLREVAQRVIASPAVLGPLFMKLVVTLGSRFLLAQRTPLRRAPTCPTSMDAYVAEEKTEAAKGGVLGSPEYWGRQLARWFILVHRSGGNDHGELRLGLLTGAKRPRDADPVSSLNLAPAPPSRGVQEFIHRCFDGVDRSTLSVGTSMQAFILPLTATALDAAAPMPQRAAAVWTLLEAAVCFRDDLNALERITPPVPPRTAAPSSLPPPHPSGLHTFISPSAQAYYHGTLPLQLFTVRCFLHVGSELQLLWAALLAPSTPRTAEVLQLCRDTQATARRLLFDADEEQVSTAAVFRAWHDVLHAVTPVLSHRLLRWLLGLQRDLTDPHRAP